MLKFQPCKQLEEVLAEELDQMISMEVLQVNETLVSVLGFNIIWYWFIFIQSFLTRAWFNVHITFLIFIKQCMLIMQWINDCKYFSIHVSSRVVLKSMYLSICNFVLFHKILTNTLHPDCSIPRLQDQLFLVHLFMWTDLLFSFHLLRLALSISLYSFVQGTMMNGDPDEKINFDELGFCMNLLVLNLSVWRSVH